MSNKLMDILMNEERTAYTLESTYVLSRSINVMSFMTSLNLKGEEAFIRNNITDFTTRDLFEQIVVNGVTLEDIINQNSDIIDCIMDKLVDDIIDGANILKNPDIPDIEIQPNSFAFEFLMHDHSEEISEKLAEYTAMRLFTKITNTDISDMLNADYIRHMMTHLGSRFDIKFIEENTSLFNIPALRILGNDHFTVERIEELINADEMELDMHQLSELLMFSMMVKSETDVEDTVVECDKFIDYYKALINLL